MLKTFKYKLDPTRKQKQLLSQTLDTCRSLYNMCLEQKQYQRISQFEQMRQLTLLKQEFPEYKNTHAHVLQNVVKTLDKAFQSFFRRLKEGGKAGYPRFKSKNRYDSIQFNNTGFRLDGKQLSVSKIGNIKVRLSRELPADAVVKTLNVKRSVNGWFATLTFEYTPTPLPKSKKKVGIDVGIENYAALSDGTMIQNPRFYECGQAELRRAQRRVARRTNKRSNRRRKAVILLQKVHARIANRRMDFLHKQTTMLVRKYGTIVVENLNVKGLAGGILSKQVHDASWSTFFRMLDWKAEEAATRSVQYVDCKYTSQECPNCGNKKKKSLSERKHNCEKCGYTTHRDTAAAQVILGRMVPSFANTQEVICV
jgi:putative transposase